jgi:hypothetical protein
MNTIAEAMTVAEALLKEWADKGKIIEGGWQAMILVARLQDAPEQQLREMRRAYMLGAQHLFSSMMVMLDPDHEPTERDLRRMDLIYEELEAFRRSLGN